MAIIRPFRGMRPKPEVVDRVAAPPYDVLSSEEARRMAEGNPLSFLHVGKPEIDLDPSISLYDERVYRKGAENFRRYLEDGIFFQDPSPCFYVYRQRMGDHVQVGLAAGASVDDYESGVIKKHELTRADKEDDRTRHVDILNAQTGPVFLTYAARPELDAMMESAMKAEPAYDFISADGIGHTFWVVSDPVWISRVQELFKEMPALYVADGHHRSAAACRVRRMRRENNPGHRGDEEYNFFYAIIFPHDQLYIMDYNRVVKDLNGLEPGAFIGKVGEKFTVEPAEHGKPGKTHCFGMYLGGRWYRLSAREGTFDAADPVRSLDVSILQDNLLAPILGIGDPRKDKRIDFVGGIRGLGELERLVNEGRAAVAFALHHTSVAELMAIADAGQIMPPKSTWFEPKLKDGLVNHLLD
ncbi:MAG: DUF1015 domain-containing protein [Acidobacteria bacterium]|nr:DUF1015 domain-containing protein [Acidobacteriota bacterium]